MEYKFEMGQGKLRVVVPKELDHHLATQLKEEADLLIETYHVKTLIFDFTNTEFMDSSGIGRFDRQEPEFEFFRWTGGGDQFEPACGADLSHFRSATADHCCAVRSGKSKK